MTVFLEYSFRNTWAAPHQSQPSLQFPSHCSRLAELECFAAAPREVMSKNRPHPSRRALGPGWRAERRKPMVSALPCGNTAGASRRANLGVFTGPAFRRRHRLEWPAGVSASSWRGLLVAPEGAPMPPECPCCVHEPAGAAPRPASRTPHDAPFKWTRSVQCKAVIECGDKVVPSTRGEVYARLRAGWGALCRPPHPSRQEARLPPRQGEG
jgi:hypothetical protein